VWRKIALILGETLLKRKSRKEGKTIGKDQKASGGKIMSSSGKGGLKEAAKRGPKRPGRGGGEG